MYQVYLRSFRDCDGDGIGDLRGLVEKLDYLASLGIDAIWLSPFFRSPQKDFGYDVSDFRAVDPVFGTLDDLLTLLDEAHRRDLRVLADFVPCHTSDAHDWFRQSRQSRTNDLADWYVWADPQPDGGPPNNWLSSFGGGAWTWEPRRAQYYYHPFLPCQPALNLRKPETLDAVIAAMAYWRDLGIDGLRLDAVQCLCWDEHLRSNPSRMRREDDVVIGGGQDNPFSQQDHLFDRDVPHGLDIVQRLRAALSGDHPEFALIGELADLDTSRLAVKYTAGTDRLHAVYDFDLIHKGDSISHWIETLNVRARYIRSGWMMNVLTNHDSQRAVSHLTDFAVDAGYRAQAAKLLLFLQTMLRGGAIIFQGEELGLTQGEVAYEDMQDPWGKNLYPDFEGRDGVRTPMPWQDEGPSAGFSDTGAAWLPVPDDHRALAVSRQDDDPDSVLSFFRDVMTWRRGQGWLRTASETAHDAATAPLIAFDRFDGEHSLTFVANFSLERRFFVTEAETVDFPQAGGLPNDSGIDLPPLGFVVLKNDPAREAD